MERLKFELEEAYKIEMESDPNRLWKQLDEAKINYTSAVDKFQEKQWTLSENHLQISANLQTQLSI